MAISINTGDYLKKRYVEIDGMTWQLKMIGAGQELAMSQAQRRIGLLDKKIANGTATEDDYNEYDKLERQFYSFFKTIFRDSTEDNSQVNNWIDEMPTSIIVKVFEEIKKQVDNEEVGTDSRAIGEGTASQSQSTTD